MLKPINDLLDLDDADDQTLSSPNGDEPKKEEEKTLDVVSEFDRRDKIIKDQRELIRQLGEDLKSVQTWKDKITGKDETEQNKQTELQLRKDYEQDELGTISKIMTNEINKVRDDVTLVKTTQEIDRAMREIDRDYVVNWDNNAKEIVSQIGYFSPEARKENAKAILIKACQLAGVIKKRETKTAPFVENSGSETKQFIAKESDKIKARIFGKQKKSSNIFGV